MACDTLFDGTAGKLVAWEGDGTSIHGDFAAVRMEIKHLSFEAQERLPLAASEAEALMRCCTDPVQLLCRSLRITPASFHRFELAAAEPGTPLQLEADVNVCWGPSDAGHHVRPNRTVSFASVAELASALQPCAAAEGVSVFLSPEGPFVGLRRDGAQVVWQQTSLCDAYGSFNQVSWTLFACCSTLCCAAELQLCCAISKRQACC